jgi:hypothetical protein
MLHLSSERLAALADSEPTPLEADHLAACVACARERAASRALLMMARAEREQLGMPLTRWDSLAPELHRAGLVTAGALMSAPARDVEFAGVRPTAAPRAARWLQAAAILFVAFGGVALGRFSAGEPLLPFGARAERHVEPPPVAPPMVLGVGPNDALVPEFRSVDDAVVALTRHQLAYQHAAAFLAEHDSTARVDDPDAYRARLVALDRAGRVMREALREAPHDPVINGYYLTTLGQREATLRQLGSALPSGHRILSF